MNSEAFVEATKSVLKAYQERLERAGLRVDGPHVERHGGDAERRQEVAIWFWKGREVVFVIEEDIGDPRWDSQPDEFARAIRRQLQTELRDNSTSSEPMAGTEGEFDPA